ncbi:phosphohistidine phosphatase, SixA [Amphritea atlantica]|uniref:Phosphohistidine phosphatase, SixA n=1 Tax=Amphritea atlantica TaxID=355243 RepID=A0A1H9FIK9_9GAMM|nr:phosphohistidine phosphatase SixA [Amphritea atlantica]SEQ37726.1 phosphohistidine phosphatase, SixA [Amphritea atlantica]
MRLLLLRHGEAGFDAPRDELRYLTERGRLQLRQLLTQQADEFAGVQRIVHSPYLRTCQTAELVREVVSVNAEPLDLLTPESAPQQVVDWLSEQRDDSLLLVTHQPLVGLLVSLLCEADLSHPEPMLPGALAIIELEFPAAGLGQLQKLLR